MRISIFGLGYVGCVSAACFAHSGHRVVGVDINTLKVDILNSGQSPIIEKAVAQLIMEGVTSGRLRATTDVHDAITETDLTLICVGTPSRDNGSLDLQHIYKVCEEIGSVLKEKNSYHVVVIRSTVMPGTVDQVNTILERTSGKKCDKDFGLSMNPEFLREGTAVHDFQHPPITLIGAENQRTLDALKDIYQGIDAPLLGVPIRTAEMVKYANNAWHAAKVTFANEIGNICKETGIDGHKVMDILCMDTKLNLSPYYLKPGFAFGGSCLPKDVRALTFRAKELNLSTPLLDSLIQSNKYQVSRVIDQLVNWKQNKLGFLGLSFKGGTDDLRESPIVEVIERMIGKGYDCKIYDSNVSLAKIFGANKKYIEEEIPHLDRLMCDNMDDVIQHADVLVVANRNDRFKQILDAPRKGQRILDLVRLTSEPPDLEGYHGICW